MKAINKSDKCTFCSFFSSWTVEKDTGHLIAYHLKREDEGKYICIAENNAGRIEAEAELVNLLNFKAETADEIYNFL